MKKLHPKATLPKYQSEGAACFDIEALIEDEKAVIVSNYCPKVFRTGLSFEIPEGFVMLAFSRSGHGFKNDIRLANCVGVIDSDYRGEVMVKLTADNRTFEVNNKDRIVQCMLVEVPRVTFDDVSILNDSERGSNGFGSTGQ